MEENINLINFATELSTIVDQSISLEHIHAISEGRFDYIQAPEMGAPMLLNHYRGPFFVDIHPDDLKKITSGEVSSHDYIYSANWQVGYFWGGGSMVKGGYYQPFDIVNRTEEVRRYFKILSCRGYYRASGYMPSEKCCKYCSVENCPFRNYKEGRWENEMEEYDPRIDLFSALLLRFENQFSGYTFRGFFCSKIEDDTIILYPNGHYVEEDPFSFAVCASENVIRDLMMRKVTPEDWNEYVKGFKFQLQKMFSHDYLDASKENVKAIFTDFDYVEKKKRAETGPELYPSKLLAKDENDGIFVNLYRFLKNIF